MYQEGERVDNHDRICQQEYAALRQMGMEDDELSLFGVAYQKEGKSKCFISGNRDTVIAFIEDCREKDIYMLGKKNERIAFYWTYENRKEDGTKYAVNGTTNHNEGGYLMCNANKSYMEESNDAQYAIASYGFFYGGNTTEIDEVSDDVKAESRNVKAVYDLSGRKLSAITAPGIYIVDGKKVFVTEIED